MKLAVKALMVDSFFVVLDKTFCPPREGVFLICWCIITADNKPGE